MKKKLLFASLLVICFAMIAGQSLAYFTREATAHNVVTTGGIAIKLNEWANDDRTEKFSDKEGVMPGDTVTKIVEVTNTGANDAWVRMSAEKSIPSVTDADLSLVELDINKEYWTDGGDGYYYYNKALASGETTEPLFTNVSVSLDMGNEYQNAEATVDVTAQAVQTANNGDSALTAKGWPKA